MEYVKNEQKKMYKEIKAESEMLMIALADLDLQRETYKTEAELAIAELAETVLGGV